MLGPESTLEELAAAFARPMMRALSSEAVISP